MIQILLIAVLYIASSHAQTDPTDPYCPRSTCGSSDNVTCCVLGSSNKDGCCPYANGTCCGLPDSTMGCCKHGWICDPIKRACFLPDQSSICQGCLNLVHKLEDMAPAACSKACDQLSGLYKTVCEFIVNLGVCGQGVLTPGLATSACSILQLCNSKGNTCPCGYCTQWTYNRCLSFPNHCPSKGPNDAYPVSRAIRKPSLSLTASGSDAELCLDGYCTEENQGCCLTCL